mmetsp:Transcript_20360/g.78217  ORF Transcript_20360/g.78217 Transcript_20360/m.78217 type:complete len:217 (-) Transcript_20360:773-1423(-)
MPSPSASSSPPLSSDVVSSEGYWPAGHSTSRRSSAVPRGDTSGAGKRVFSRKAPGLAASYSSRDTVRVCTTGPSESSSDSCCLKASGSSSSPRSRPDATRTGLAASGPRARMRRFQPAPIVGRASMRSATTSQSSLPSSDSGSTPRPATSSTMLAGDPPACTARSAMRVIASRPESVPRSRWDLYPWRAAASASVMSRSSTSSPHMVAESVPSLSS